MVNAIPAIQPPSPLSCDGNLYSGIVTHKLSKILLVDVADFMAWLLNHGRERSIPIVVLIIVILQ